MKKILTAILVSVIAFTVSYAQEEARGLASIWKSAEDAYSMGDFDGAIKEYETLVSSGAASPSLFYNLGNAHYR